MRKIAKLSFLTATTLILGGCVSFNDHHWSEYVGSGECKFPSAQPQQNGASMPYYLVTSRLPDCRSDNIKLTIQRGDQIRYGKFASPAEHDKDNDPPVRFTSGNSWWDQLTADLRTHRNDAKDAGRIVVYIHGYNNSFGETALRSHKIRIRTGFKGPIIHYSWPSHERFLRYTVDQANQEWNREYFKRILWQLAAHDEIKDITLVAHSMGARAAIDVVSFLDENQPGRGAKIKNIILASADLDRQLFEQRAGDVLLTSDRLKNGRNITIYTSRKDRAVSASKFLHGYGRVGTTNCIDPNIVKGRDGTEISTCYAQPQLRNNTPVKGLSVVDTSEVREGLLGHADFIDSPVACTDFALTVNGGNMDWNGRTPDKAINAWWLKEDAQPSARCTAPLSDFDD